MLRREKIELKSTYTRVNKMQRDEKIREDDIVAAYPVSLLDKIRSDERTVTLAPHEKEQRMKSKQRKMRKIVKASCMTYDERFENASPTKIQKTGNVVLDKINQKVEKQRKEV